jgi:tRNA-specific 2-thiouridylase
MPFYVLNLCALFREAVIDPFVGAWLAGLTPNPCVLCNRRVKFGALLDRALAMGFPALATGHYARTERDRATGRTLLLRAADEKKDQSYMLYALAQRQLAAARFPVGGLTKGEAREIARARGLATAAKRDSQDICFVPGGGHAGFIERYTGRPAPEGDFVDEGGAVVGRHRGAIRYTVGQRKGLGLGRPFGGEPAYVLSKAARGGAVTVGPERRLYAKSLEAGDANLIPFDALPGRMRVAVRTRYSQGAAPAVVEQVGEGRLHVEFDEPQRAIAPGQAAVLYDGDHVVGGGTIL